MCVLGSLNDETLYAIQSAVDRLSARRVVLDSISGPKPRSPCLQEDFLESLYRLWARSPAAV